MWWTVAQQQGEVVPPEQFNWQARFNLSYDGAVDDTITGWNTLRPTLVEGKIPATTSFTGLVDQSGNPLTGVTLTVSEGTDVFGESSSGPSTPIPTLFNQQWRSVNPWRIIVSGLDNNKRYTLQILTQSSTVSTGQIITTTRLQTNGNADYDVISRDATSPTPDTLSFTDEAWVRFDGASRDNGVVNFRMERNGSTATMVIQAIILTEYEKTINGVQTLRTTGTTTSPLPFIEYVPNGSGLKPAFIFLHGSGERGDGSTAALNNALKYGPNRQVLDGNFTQDAYAFTPQIPTSGYWYDNGQNLSDFIDYVLSEYSVDPQRVYLIGFSDGASGIGTGVSASTINRIAAAISITYDPGVWGSSTTDPDYTDYFDINKIAAVPTWTFKNRYYNASWGGSSYTNQNVIDGVTELNSINPGSAKFTMFDDWYHTDSSKILNGTGMGSMIDSNYDPFDQDIYDWLLTHTL